MKTEVTSLNPTRKRLSVEIPAEGVREIFDETLKKARKSLNVPGFRKGKAPIELVRARVGDDLGAQVSETLLERYVGVALKEEKLAALPDGVFMDLEDDQEEIDPAVEGESYRFSVLVDVRPEIDPQNYSGLKIARPKAELGDDDVQREMDALRESFGRTQEVDDRASQTGDFVEVEIEGQEVAGGELKLAKKVQRIHLGAEGNLPEFDQQLGGRRPGDVFDFELLYPEDFPNEDFRGKTMHFMGEVKTVLVRHVPELTDEIVASATGVENLAELRDKIREGLQARKEAEATAVAKRRLLDKLLDETPFEAPMSMVEGELRERLESIGRNMARSGIDPDKAGIEWEKVIAEERVAAMKAVREALLLDRIAEKEGLDVEAAEIDRAIEGMAAESQQSPRELRAQLKKHGGLKGLRIQVLRRKCLDWVYEKTDIC